MFFRKSTVSAQHPAMAEALAGFFALEAAQVQGWIDETPVGFDISLPFVCASLHHELSMTLQPHAKGKPVVLSHCVPLGGKVQRGLRHIKQLVAIASGKGGVGKSSTCVNLALALQKEGARVGILDADIYGPSIPLMLGNPHAQPDSEDNKHMQPLIAHNLVANSIGYLVGAGEAAIWRGPMASKALQQLLYETLWPELDYLLIDMPPGTGDIQLTLAQQVPVTGAVVVTTPQNIALADAQKAIAMFDKVSVPVLGVLENMSYHQCTQCGYREHLFAEGGGERLSAENQVPLLGQIPLDIHIRQYTDAGRALILEQPDHPLSVAYADAARRLARQLYLAGLMQPQAIDISQG